MKLLQNKETGGIGWLYANRGENYDVLDEDGRVMAVYGSLAELNAEWKDYEAPKGLKSIGTIGPSIHIEFGSKEEAEQAFEKIKAWERLKDKGLSFRHWKEAPLRPHSSCIAITGNMECDVEARKDLDLLFGGEK